MGDDYEVRKLWRAYRRAALDFAEAVNAYVRAGSTVDDIAANFRCKPDEIHGLIKLERLAGANRRRHRRIRSGAIEPNHGTSEGKLVDCHCEACEAYLQSERDAGRARRERGLADGDPRHGTHTGFQYGCRCDRCRNAEDAYRWSRPLTVEQLERRRVADRERKRRKRAEERQPPQPEAEPQPVDEPGNGDTEPNEPAEPAEPAQQEPALVASTRRKTDVRDD